MSFTRLQVPPHSLALCQVDVAERYADLPDRVVAAEAIIVQHLEVQGSAHQLAVRETCTQSGKQRVNYRTGSLNTVSVI